MIGQSKEHASGQNSRNGRWCDRFRSKFAQEYHIREPTVPLLIHFETSGGLIMKIPTIINSVFLPIMLSIALGHVGCVSSASKNLVGSYGKSTANLSATATSTFQTVRENENHFRVAQALANPSLSVNKGLAPPTIEWKSIALRVSLLSELGKYGKALEAMASDAELDRIDEASRNLGEAVGGLNNRVQEVKGDEKPPLTSEQLGTVATVTNVAGRWFFERERYQAMLETVEITDPLIQQTVDLLLTELQEDGPWKGHLSTQLKDQAQNLYLLAQTSHAQYPDKEVKLETINVRRSLLEEAIRLTRREEILDQEFKALVNGLKKVKEAHGKLKEALQNDSDFNVRKAADYVSQIENEVSRIQAFHQSIPKSS